MNRPPHVLVLRPEYLRWNVAAGLARDFRVELAADTDWEPGTSAPDVTILVGVPDLPTIRLCGEVAATPGSALIVACLDDRPNAQLPFLRAGADDVVPASVPPEVLAARVTVQVRHRRLILDRPGVHVEVGALSLDTRAGTAAVSGRPLRLPPALFQTLHALVANAGETVSVEALHRAAGNTALAGRPGNAVRIAISRLRTALGDRPDVPVIETVRLVGYRLELPPPPARAHVIARTR